MKKKNDFRIIVKIIEMGIFSYYVYIIQNNLLHWIRGLVLKELWRCVSGDGRTQTL